MNNDLFKRAKERVENDPKLAPFFDTILYDWNEGDEHLEWVLAEETDEIVKWAEIVEEA